MPYFGLRLTLGEIFNVPDEELKPEHLHRITYLINHLIREKIDKEYDYILGKEKLNKFGEKTKFHYHFNFYSDDKLETLRKSIIRKSESLEYKLKGNKMYCLQSFPEPDDYHRWFRYCMKEKYDKKYTKYTPEENDPTLAQLQMMAKDERKQTVLANIKVRSKQLDKRTLFDKIVKHLEKKDLKTYEEIYIAIFDYYVAEGKPVNDITIMGYTYNYMVRIKLMTSKAFFDYKHQHRDYPGK